MSEKIKVEKAKNGDLKIRVCKTLAKKEGVGLKIKAAIVSFIEALGQSEVS